MDRSQAQRDIERVFGKYKAIRKADKDKLNKLAVGKLYELYALSRLLLELSRRGFRFRFQGKTLEFKASPGNIDPSSPHFEVFTPHADQTAFKVFTDIQFKTLGSSMNGVSTDKSGYHELDIAVVLPTASGMPQHDQIALGIECKAVANFTKNIVREVLGVRRELSLLTNPPQPSVMSQCAGASQVMVPANPASEFWLAYIDPKGNDYAASPDSFGIRFKYWKP